MRTALAVIEFRAVVLGFAQAELVVDPAKEPKIAGEHPSHYHAPFVRV